MSYEKLTFDQFLKTIQEGNHLARDILYDYYSHGFNERERQREKAKKRYAKLKENKNRQSE